MEREAIRVLQILSDTSDSVANLNALRFHQMAVGHGYQVRTLALGPGPGAYVTRTVPAMAPSSKSLSASTQLRRELKWADAMVAVDCVPRGIGTSGFFGARLMASKFGGPTSHSAEPGRGRNQVPTVIRVTPGNEPRVAECLAKQPSGRIDAVMVQDVCSVDTMKSLIDASIPVVAVGVAYAPSLQVGSTQASQAQRRLEAPRRAARTGVGVSNDDLVVVSLDLDTGNLLDRPAHERAVDQANEQLDLIGVADASTAKDRPGLRYLAPSKVDADIGADPEVLMHAADLVIVVNPHGVAAAALVDMMALGAVPVFVGTDPAMVSRVPGSDPNPTDGASRRLFEPSQTILGPADTESELVEVLMTAAQDSDEFGAIRIEANTRCRRLCDPEEVVQQWSKCLDQALPSLT